MRRRDVLVLLGGATVFRPLASLAQQKGMPVIGYLATGSSDLGVVPFRRGLSETGRVVGQNLAIEYRAADNQIERLPGLAAELVSRKVDLIVAAADPAARAAKRATSTIPIVFVVGQDPVELGLVASLSRPSGNLTGLTTFTSELQSKRLDLLSELVPQAREIALLVNSKNTLNAEHQIGDVRQAARAKGLQVRLLMVNTESEIDAVFVQLQGEALVVSPSPFFSGQRNQLLALASRLAIPAVYAWREDAVAGGLMSYGPSVGAAYHDAGVDAGKILSGDKPADLPVQQPTKFELVINMKTAKALGLTVPQTLLARADEVIE
jgi:putative ABC transport system substrate-binding protein